MSQQRMKLEVLLATINQATGPLKAITKGSTETAKALKEARARLRELNDTQKNMDGFRKLDKDIGITANQMKAAQQRVKELKLEMAATGKPTAAMTREMNKAVKEARSLKDRHGELIIKQQQLRTELNGSGMDTRKLAEHQRTLKTDIANATSAVERQTAALKQQSDIAARMHAARAARDKGLQTRDQIAGAGASTMAAGVAMGMPIIKTVKDFSSVESALTQLKISMMDSSGKISAGFDQIAQKAEDLGGKLPGTTEEFVRMSTMLKNQGMAPEDIINGGLEASAYLSVVMEGEKERTAEIVAKVREAHGLAGDQLPQAADLIKRANTGFGLTEDQIFEAMKYVATDLNAKGMVGNIDYMKQFLAIEGVMAQKGLEGSSFGTNFSHMLKSMAMAENKLVGAKGAEGQYVRGLLEAKNIKFNFFKDGQFAGFENMVAELEKLKVFSDQDQERILKKLFDTEGMRPALTLLKEGVSGFKEAIATMDAQASLEDRIEISLGTLANTYEAMGGSANKLSTTLGAVLAPTLKETFETVGSVLEKITEWAKEHLVLVAFILKTVAALAILSIIIGSLLLAIAAIMGPLVIARYGFALLGIKGAALVPILKGIGTAIMLIGRMLLLNPIGLLITGIAVAALLIYKYWGPIKGFFSRLWDAITERFNRFIKPIKAALSAVGEWFGNSNGGPQLAGAGAGGGMVSVKPVAPIRAGGSSVQHNNYSPSITVNPSPGMNEEELAAKIKREIENDRHTWMARNRSSLKDRE